MKFKKLIVVLQIALLNSYCSGSDIDLIQSDSNGREVISEFVFSAAHSIQQQTPQEITSIRVRLGGVERIFDQINIKSLSSGGVSGFSLEKSNSKESLVFGIVEDSFIGVVDTEGGAYWIRALSPTQNGDSGVVVTKLPEEFKGFCGTSDLDVVKQINEQVFDSSILSAGPLVIDVLFWWTPEAVQRLSNGISGVDQACLADVDAAIACMIAKANLVMANSTLNVVYNAVPSYPNPVLSEADPNFPDFIGLPGLTSLQSDGFLDDLPEYRSIYRADLVAGITASGGQGAIGIATLNGSYSASVVPGAFGSVLAHEFGHNMGLFHSHGSTSGSTSSSYASGHVWFDQPGDTSLTGTIMGTSTNQGFISTRISQYSNPDQLHNGNPTGIAVGLPDHADSVLWLEDNMQLITTRMTGPWQDQDCDQNGEFDVLDIYYGALDCDGDEILDSCQIASDPSLDCDLDGGLDSCQIYLDSSLDCNENGVLDSCEITSDPSVDCNNDSVLDVCQVSWENSYTYLGSLPSSGFGGIGATIATIVIEDIPDVQSDLSMVFRGSGAYIGSVVFTLSINGVVHTTLFDEPGVEWQNCMLNTETVVFPYGTFPGALQDGSSIIEVSANKATQPNCSYSTMRYTVSFQSISEYDDDRDGIHNCADTSCGVADLNTDGVLDFLDISLFNTLFSANDPLVDLGVPLGVWDTSDLSVFLDAYSNGCP